MPQHGSGYFRSAHAIGKWHLGVFIELAFQYRTQNESDDHENNTNDNQHRNVVLLIFLASFKRLNGAKITDIRSIFSTAGQT